MRNSNALSHVAGNGSFYLLYESSDQRREPEFAGGPSVCLERYSGLY